MGYYWVTTAQAYVQHLGFGSRLRPVNQRQIEPRIDQYGGDNSFFRENKADITLGKGGVDDAEDAEVIVHEYGHSVQDGQVPGFGTTLQSGAIGEGFGDYLAVVVTSWRWRAKLTPEACVADWDSVSYTSTIPHCLRRLDGTKVYPDDLENEVHGDGEIWSRALWDIRGSLGDVEATTLIVDAQFAFAKDTSFPLLGPRDRRVGPAALRHVSRQAGHQRVRGARDPLTGAPRLCRRFVTAVPLECRHGDPPRWL